MQVTEGVYTQWPEVNCNGYWEESNRKVFTNSCHVFISEQEEAETSATFCMGLQKLVKHCTGLSQRMPDLSSSKQHSGRHQLPTILGRPYQSGKGGRPGSVCRSAAAHASRLFRLSTEYRRSAFVESSGKTVISSAPPVWRYPVILGSWLLSGSDGRQRRVVFCTSTVHEQRKHRPLHSSRKFSGDVTNVITDATHVIAGIM